MSQRVETKRRKTSEIRISAVERTAAKRWPVLPLLVSLAFIVIITLQQGMGLQDIPNHLVRGKLISEIALGEGAAARNFHFSLMFVPYILGDLLVATFTTILPFRIAAKLVTILSLFSLPFAALAYASIRQFSATQKRIVFVVSLYLASSYFFINGYINYCLSIALALLLPATFHLAVSSERGARQVAYLSLTALLTVTTYLTHLAGFLFGSAILCCSISVHWFFHRRALVSGLVALLTPVLLLAVHFHQGRLGSGENEPYLFSTPGEKLLTLGSASIRYWPLIDILIGLLFLSIPIAFLLRAPKVRTLSERSIECGLTFLALFGLFLALPSSMPPALEVDARALPLVGLFALFTAMSLSLERGFRARRISLNALSGVCALMSLLNVVAVGLPLLSHDKELRLYEEVFERADLGGHVLPIDTIAPVGRIKFGIHSGALSALREGAITPWIFSSELVPTQIPYFSYAEPFYMPNPFWYQEGLSIDSERILETYDSIVATKPFDESRLGLQLRKVYENDGAIAYRIEKGASLATLFSTSQKEIGGADDQSNTHTDNSCKNEEICVVPNVGIDR